MKALTISILFLLAIGWINARDITDINGVVYENVSISKKTPVGIEITYEKGIKFLPFVILPNDVQVEFGYDKEKAKQYLEDQETEKQKYLKKLEEKAAQLKQELDERNKRLAQFGILYIVTGREMRTEKDALMHLVQLNLKEGDILLGDDKSIYHDKYKFNVARSKVTLLSSYLTDLSTANEASLGKINNMKQQLSALHARIIDLDDKFFEAIGSSRSGTVYDQYGFIIARYQENVTPVNAVIIAKERNRLIQNWIGIHQAMILEEDSYTKAVVLYKKLQLKYDEFENSKTKISAIKE